MRNTVTNTQHSKTSSSALVIIITLALITAAAFVLGGSSSFSKKYAGLASPEDRSWSSTLAQVGVVGKNLRFEGNTETGFQARLSSIDLDGSVLGVSQKFTATVVPPLEGDNPFWYRTTVGDRSTAQGYPLRQSFAQALAVSPNLSISATLPGSLQPLIPGMTICSNGSRGADDSALYVFFEDVAYETGVGFDDPLYGAGRQQTVCNTIQEFEEILRIQETITPIDPVIVVQASDTSVPNAALSVVSPQYVGGSGFVSTLLADLLRTGARRSQTDLTPTVPVLGSNAGFMRYNFDSVAWKEDTGSDNAYSMATVTRQNMLRLLGFGSFVGHEQENVLSSAWRRWTEWDRLLFAVGSEEPLINPMEKFFFSIGDLDTIDLNNTSANNYDPAIRGENGGVVAFGSLLPDSSVLSFANEIPLPIFTLSNWQRGQSLSGLADLNAVSYPILAAGEERFVTEEERQILCMLGLAVDGVSNCDTPRSVVRDRYIEHQSNKAVCVNVFDNVANSFTNNLRLAGPVSEVAVLDFNINNPQVFQMYTEPCETSVFDTPEEKTAFANQYATTNHTQAKSFSWTPQAISTEGGDMNAVNLREFVQFEYAVEDIATGRVSDPGVVSIHKCVILPQGEQLCNGDFQFSGARSPIDFQLASFRFIENVSTDDILNDEALNGGNGAGDVNSGPFLMQNTKSQKSLFDTRVLFGEGRGLSGFISALFAQRPGEPEPTPQIEVPEGFPTHQNCQVSSIAPNGDVAYICSSTPGDGTYQSVLSTFEECSNVFSAISTSEWSASFLCLSEIFHISRPDNNVDVPEGFPTNPNCSVTSIERDGSVNYYCYWGPGEVAGFPVPGFQECIQGQVNFLTDPMAAVEVTYNCLPLEDETPAPPVSTPLPGWDNVPEGMPSHPNCVPTLNQVDNTVSYVCSFGPDEVPEQTPLPGFEECLMTQPFFNQDGDFTFSASCDLPTQDTPLPTPSPTPMPNPAPGQPSQNGFIECSSTSIPGWCAQGSPSVYSSVHGYTWHPYLIDAPRASGHVTEGAPPTPQKFAGISSDLIVQRLRAPLQSNLTYEVSGKVYLENQGIRPTFWYANESALSQQADGSFHIEYPAQMLPENSLVAERIELFPEGIPLSEPDVNGWYDFSVTFSPGSVAVTHVGFGSVGTGSPIFFDNLSIKYFSGCTSCSADLNGDCVVNNDDMLIFLSVFGTSCPEGTIGCPGDFNFDGVVDNSDMLMFLASFGASCPVFEETGTESTPLSLGDLDPNGRLNNLVAQVSRVTQSLQTTRDTAVTTARTEITANTRNTSVSSREGVVVRATDDRDRALIMEDSDVGRDVSSQGRVPVQKSIIALSEDIMSLERDDLNIFFKLLDRPQVVRNSRGFTSNFVVWIENKREETLRGLELIGLMPSYIEYKDHVATRNDTNYRRAVNSLRMQSLPSEQENQIYFDVKLDDNMCAYVLRENRAGYRVLSDMSLCQSEQEIQRQREEFERQQQARSRRAVRQPIQAPSLGVGCYIDKTTNEEVCVTAGVGECYFQAELGGEIIVDECPDRVSDGWECFPGRDPGTWSCSDPNSSSQPVAICSFKKNDVVTSGECPDGVEDGWNCVLPDDDSENWECVAPVTRPRT